MKKSKNSKSAPPPPVVAEIKLQESYLAKILSVSDSIPFTVKCAAPILILLWILLKFLIRPHKPMKFKGRHCIVTGGSSGIGKEVAKELARRGATVTIVARNATTLETALVEIQKCASDSTAQRFGSLSMVLGTDSYEDVQASLDGLQKAIGPCSALFNVAGVSVPQTVEEIPAAAMESMYRTNVLSAMHMTKAVLSSMIARGEGRIVLTSSLGGLIATYGYASYAATKFALRGFAEALQMEVKAHGIAVCLASPPDTDTPGYVTENVVKTPLCAKISSDGGMFTSYQVAQDIVNGAELGTYCITTGLDGWLTSLTTAGFAPANSIFAAVTSVMGASIVRAVSFFYQWNWYSMVAKEVQQQKKSR